MAKKCKEKRTIGKWRGEGRGLSGHTDTTRSHIGGNHDGTLAGLEFVEYPISLVLLLVAVNSCGFLVLAKTWGRVYLTKSGPAILSEESCNFISDSFGAGENEDLVSAIFHDLLHVFDHSITLLEV